LDVTLTSLKNKHKFFKINWFNKLHFSTHSSTSNLVMLYLRAAKHFNKGRYSRNRQLYRTGVYWCIWLNIVIVYALHFYFYRIVYSFGYIWLPLGLLILSIFSSRLYKYRYYNINQIIVEFKEFNNLLFLLFLKFKHVYKDKIVFYIHKIFKLLQNYVLLLYIYITNKILKIVGLFKKNVF
jgi:hypothetical protein